MSGVRAPRVGQTREGASPLLRIVCNQPHAREEDHEEQVPERSTVGAQSTKHNKIKDVEDIHADPMSSDLDSSSDDKENDDALKPPPPRKGAPVRTIRAPGRANTTGVSNIHAKPSTASSTKPKISRKASDMEDNFEDATERIVFNSSQTGSQKRQKATYGKRAPKPTLDKVPEKLKLEHPVGLDKPRSIQEPRPFFTNPNATGTHEEPIPVSSQTPSITFVRRNLDLPTSTDTSAISKVADPPTSPVQASSPLSELMSPEPEFVAQLKMPRGTVHIATTPCPLCGEQVDETMKRDFLIEKCKGKRMNFRLQEQFCKLHKERTAKKAWQDREYPEIDWSTLHKRLKNNKRRIQDVLDGKIHSVYRAEVEERVRSGKTKSALQVWINEEDTSVSVGYYGSRGEKAMADYIVKNFGEELRRRAGTDSVINSMGISGGVSGYMQTVLVPEMALALVMEDANCDVEEARRIIKESSDIGEALNEVEEEKVPQSTAVVSLLDSEDEDEADDYHDDALLHDEF